MTREELKDLIWSIYKKMIENEELGYQYFIDTNNGFDVLALLSDLPFFWIDKISILDINPDFIENHSYINHKKYKLINPWGRIYKIDLIVTNILRKLNNGKFYNLYVYILNKFFWKQRLKKLVHD